MKTGEIWKIGATVVVALLLVLAIGSFSKGDSQNKVTGNAILDLNGEFQEVVLSFENYGYKVTPPVVEVGVPVKMIADADSLPGCMKDIRIPAFGISKYVTATDNVITFLPSKTGVYTITCSMSMGVGEIVVQ